MLVMLCVQVSFTENLYHLHFSESFQTYTACVGSETEPMQSVQDAHQQNNTGIT